MLRCDDSNVNEPSPENDVASEEEYDELFNKMQVIGNERREFNKKRKRIKLTTEQDERSLIDDRDVSRFLIILVVTSMHINGNLH